MKTIGRSAFVIIIASLLLGGCSGGHDSDDSGTIDDLDPGSIDVSQADYCDITQPSLCLLPFPNNFYTRADGATETGLRVAFDPRAIPLNQNQDPFDVTEWNRNDGFSPGPVLVAHVPELDLAKTGAAPLTDIEQSLAGDGPIQLINAATGERQLIWAELDSRAQSDDKRALLIHAGKTLLEGERYIVVLQNLLDASGQVLEPSDAFKIYRDAVPSEIPGLEHRRADFESLFASLDGFGIKRDTLYLSWDFTVASTTNTTRRILHMRDTSLANLAAAAPAISIDDVVENTVAEDPNWARFIKGTITVPNFLDSVDGASGSRLNYADSDPDALPAQFNGDGMVEVPFDCGIPHAALADAGVGTVDTRAVVVGHGLFGSREMVARFGEMAQEQNLFLCGMDWWGMSSADFGTTSNILGNINLFPSLPDRLQQSFLNIIFLSETMVRAGGFQAMTEFQNGAGVALFKTGEVHFDGVSQGAVLGGALSALNPNFKRTVLNVAGTRFSFLLRRSNAWSDYSKVFDPAYPDELEQPLILSLTQMLWDRAENNGYVNHLTRNPLPGSGLTRVLIHVALGDQTVTETSSEILSRTLQVQRHNPTIVEGRHIAVEPYVGIEPISTYPHVGNALVVWDSGPFPTGGHDGTPLQTGTNQPQTEGYNTHAMPFFQREARNQKALFWRSGQVENVCGAAPCYGDGYDGTPGEYTAP